jgi:hypothetical protein
MRKLLFAATIAAAAIAASFGIVQAQPYGPGMMGGYGGGYGPGYMMGPGYGSGYGMGPGMMYGYGPNGERYYGRQGQAYRGKRLCWHQTDAQRNEGYYEACPN